MTIFTEEIETHWESISSLFTFRDEREYDASVTRMNELLDEIGTDETHSLYDLLDTLGTLVQVYDDEHYSVPDAKGIDVLDFLMDEHDLNQSDLPEVGSQGVVSEILNGKRELNIRQIRALAERFCISPAVFI